jgi:hypothetical protein
VTEPPGLEELARTRCTPKQKELNRKDLEHLMRLPEQVADVLGSLAPLASAVGPPAPEQIAQARGEPPPPPSRRRPPKRSGPPPSFRVRVNERSAG